jgi:plastocyanin
MEGTMKILKVSAAILAFAVVMAAWGQETKEAPTVAAIGADGVQRVEITGGKYYFDPNYIVVKVNVPVEFTVRKAGGATPHNIVLRAPEAGIDFAVSLKKEPRTIAFTPTKAGKYPFWCSERFLFFKSHKAHGMTGTLEVVE